LPAVESLPFCNEPLAQCLKHRNGREVCLTRVLYVAGSVLNTASP